MFTLNDFESFLKIFFLDKSKIRYFFLVFLIFLKLILENQCLQRINLSFYLLNGVQIGLFLSWLIKSITSLHKCLFLRVSLSFVKFSCKEFVLKISL